MKTVLALHTVNNWMWYVQLAGLRRFASESSWRLEVRRVSEDPAKLNREAERAIAATNPVGVIALTARTLSEKTLGGRPVVYYDSPAATEPGVTSVRHDAAETAHLAARELFSMKRRHFAFAAYYPGFVWCDERETAFAEEVRRRQGELMPAFHPVRASLAAFRRGLRDWLRGLPKPCGIFAANDFVAEQVIRVAVDCGFAVPDEVAVVGVDDDRVRCARTDPSITSVAPDWEGGAFQAVTVLSDALRGRHVSAVHLFRPLGLIRRDSTARPGVIPTFGVAAAVELIRAKACQGLGVPEVVAVMRCSRRLAEMQFRSATGTSILEEIRRVRIENARVALSYSDREINAIANACGFKSVPTFCNEFKRATGLTPREWRRLR